MSNKLIKNIKVRKGDLIKRLDKLKQQTDTLVKKNEIQPLLNIQREIMQISRNFDDLHFKLLDIEEVKDEDLEIVQRDKFQTKFTDLEFETQAAIQSINMQIDEEKANKQKQIDEEKANKQKQIDEEKANKQKQIDEEKVNEQIGLLVSSLRAMEFELTSTLNVLLEKVFSRRETLKEFIQESENIKNKYQLEYSKLMQIKTLESEVKVVSDTMKIQDVFNQIKFSCKNQIDGLAFEAEVKTNFIQNSDYHDKVKLPKIDVPTYSGQDQDDWLTFKNMFEQIIHDNKSLSPLEKFKYLISSLRGDALSLIKSIPITNESYDGAWETLKMRYHNVRKLVFKSINNLFSFPRITTPSPQQILRLHDVLSNFMQAIVNLGYNFNDFSDTLLVYLIQQKMDNDTKEWWDRHVRDTYPSKKDLPKVQELLIFLEKQSGASDFDFTSTGTRSAEYKKRDANVFPPKSKFIAPTKKVAFVAERDDLKVQSNNTGFYKSKSSKSTKTGNQIPLLDNNFVTKHCACCQGSHPIFSCQQFLKESVKSRIKIIQENNLCYNCLGQNHVASKCYSKRTCNICGEKHNSLLHLGENKQKQKANDTPSTSFENVSNFVSAQNKEVLLFTARIKVKDSQGMPQICRAIIDSGSQTSIISESCLRRLKLKTKPTNMLIKGVSGECVNGFEEVAIKFGPHFSNDQNFHVTAISMAEFDKTLPRVKLKRDRWPNKIILADPQYFLPAPIDVLLGMDAYSNLTKTNYTIKIKNLIAIETELGFVIGGKSTKHYKKPHRVCDSNLAISSVNFSLQSFWELDSVPKTDQRSPEDRLAELHFKTNFQRLPEGRYQVRLPFRENVVVLGNSMSKACSQLRRVLANLQKDPRVHEMYNDFLQEYLDLSHMCKIPKSRRSSNNAESYYLPHHHVLKEDKTTTKLRVVFNGSAVTSSGVSLNDKLLQGPVVQDSLFSLLIRFRLNPVAFIADIEKMYRQILIHPDDQPYQRILWQQPNQASVEEYQLKTITYGTAPAAFLATRTLQQLAIDEKAQFPKAAEVLESSFYVDDLLSGSSSIEEARDLVEQLFLLLQKGGFTLRKWVSNVPSCLQNVCMDAIQLNPVEISKDKIKTLGILWNYLTDEFQFEIAEFSATQSFTKRSMLSFIAKIFDPMGWLTPFCLTPKVLIQSLWRKKISWDMPIPAELAKIWVDWLTQLKDIKKISIPRYILSPGFKFINIHGFSDASEKAYAAVVYISIVTKDGNIKINLLTSKTKLAPMKQRTIPQLELCGCLLLAKLLKASVESLQIPKLNVFAWTDSTIALDWFKSSKRLEVFVGNRKSKILSIVPLRFWKHVPGNQNPADLPSRGATLDKLNHSDIWWNGPDFLLCYSTRGVNNFQGLPSVR